MADVELVIELHRDRKERMHIKRKKGMENITFITGHLDHILEILRPRGKHPQEKGWKGLELGSIRFIRILV